MYIYIYILPLVSDSACKGVARVFLSAFSLKRSFGSSLPACAMPGPWISAATDPEAWKSSAIDVGDYLEFHAYDVSHTVLGRVDKIEPRTSEGQWAEMTFLAVSDDHLL